MFERLFDSDIIPVAGLFVLACAAYLVLRKRTAAKTSGPEPRRPA